MSDLRLEDLRAVKRYNRDTASGLNEHRLVTASEVASACPTEVLIEVLVERGVNTFIVQREHGYLPSGVYWWPTCFSEEFAPCTPQEGDHGSCGYHYLVAADLVKDSEDAEPVAGGVS